jgi:tetratricopeptide (TPR) repeat protein
VRFVSDPTTKPSDGFVADPTDQDYVKAARWALSNKNYRLAIEQAAAAVALRPEHEPYVKLLDEAIAASRGPLDLLKLPEEGAFFGLCAARARALARFERVDDALECLFTASSFSPYTPFLPWGVAWVAHARSAKRVTPQHLAASIVEFVSRTTHLSLDAGVLSNLDAALAIATKVHAHYPGESSLLIAERQLHLPMDDSYIAPS